MNEDFDVKYYIFQGFCNFNPISIKVSIKKKKKTRTNDTFHFIKIRQRTLWEYIFLLFMCVVFYVMEFNQKVEDVNCEFYGFRLLNFVGCGLFG